LSSVAAEVSKRGREEKGIGKMSAGKRKDEDGNRGNRTQGTAVGLIRLGRTEEITRAGFVWSGVEGKKVVRGL